MIYKFSQKYPFFVEFLYEVSANSEDEAKKKYKEGHRECISKGLICEEIDGHGLDCLDEAQPQFLGISEKIL